MTPISFGGAGSGDKVVFSDHPGFLFPSDI